MQDVLDVQQKRITAMRRILQQEDRSLAQEKNRILSWQRDLSNKYQDDVFQKTKTRAEEREIQAAIASWRSRQVRQRTRGEMLAEAEKEFEANQDLYRDATR